MPYYWPPSTPERDDVGALAVRRHRHFVYGFSVRGSAARLVIAPRRHAVPPVAWLPGRPQPLDNREPESPDSRCSTGAP
jgi:hypothetical protein